jgi:AraC-like DNA-binding protein
MVRRPAQPTASVVCVTKIVAVGVERGLAPEKMLAVAGVSAAALADPESRVEVERVEKLWELAVTTLRDAAFPIQVARITTVEDHDVMGLAILCAPDGRDALERAVRYGRLFTEAGTWVQHADGERVTIEWRTDRPRSQGANAAAECAIGEFVHAIRLTTGRRFVPRQVFFRHAPPRDASKHEEFFGCEVRFGSALAGFSFAAGELDAWKAQPNPALSDFVIRHAEEALARRSEGLSLSHRVQAAVLADLCGGHVSAQSVARRLHVSERTLRRQLRDEGVGFRELFDSVRKSRAHALLAERRSTKEVAFLLGFSEASAFSRAFKRWTGRSPGSMS